MSDIQRTETYDNHLNSMQTPVEAAAVGPPGSGPSYYNWRELFPDLQMFLDNLDVITEEAKTVHNWTPWPEDHFARNGVVNWTVFPFLHTFPALDTSRQTWIPSTCAHCPRTAELLRKVPNIRTALFSRLGSGTQISPHTGWADLANHVLRCHISLIVPPEHMSGLWVDMEEQYHRVGEIIVFDDSKIHKAFNVPLTVLDGKDELTGTGSTGASQNNDRIVLIVDILRPSHLPLGGATGGHTPELDNFISMFK